jgi:oxygen-independent coproporphyrinogen III oxidase
VALSVYVHIPYCLQRCRYCDFTTFEASEIDPPEVYVPWLLQEIRNRRRLWTESSLHTLYFGGGTPSLIDPSLIVAICDELANVGLDPKKASEVTLEINPATVNERSLDMYLEAGIRRFSVGAQTFNDRLLKLCGRRHTSEDTRKTLQLLQNRRVSYSFDLLFALPSQTLADLDRDLAEVQELSPPHVSPYCLTVPTGHPMSTGRPPEGEQIEMFERILSTLTDLGLEKYEISNFAKPGYESRHNQVYWSGDAYWGVGLSSHSYQPSFGDHGLRFWNPKKMSVYEAQSRSAQNGALSSFTDVLPEEQYEVLQAHEALTDGAHVSLRRREGWSEDSARKLAGSESVYRKMLRPRLDRLVERGLLRAGADANNDWTWWLTREGELLNNVVLGQLTFSAQDMMPTPLTPGNLNPY